MHFTELIDLAAERLGGAVLWANDEFFAPKENLLKADSPVLREGEYTDRGKWMDGWETRRRRSPGFDWCLVRLGLPGAIHGVVVDTTHFKVNYPEQCSLEACTAEGHPDAAQLEASEQWVEILKPSRLQGDVENAFPIEAPQRFTHLRFKICPDGGVARLRVYGTVKPDWSRVARNQEIDLAAVENGGLVTACSDMYFGHRHHLILPGPALNMSDGWETRRRRGPGHDWVVIKLGARAMVQWIEVDTTHFKGNFPESCSLEALTGESWKELLPRTPLQGHTRHFFGNEIQRVGPSTHVRFNIYPDGGVSRLRVIGKLCRDGLERFNALLPDEAGHELLACCGSSRWANRMAAQRPFLSRDELLSTADLLWWSLEPLDWLEALGRHKRSAVTGAEEAHRAYEEKFSYVFLAVSAGKSADEMVALMRERLGNDPESELRVAAEEQRKITRVRLEKLVSE